MDLVHRPSSPYRTEFADQTAFDHAWRRTAGWPRGERKTLREIALFVGGGLSREGFRVFHNGGLPLLERRRGPLWEEVLFLPGPREEEFALRLHLSHEGVGEVRGHYWRPSIRAPKVVAVGDVSLLEPLPVHCIWSTSGMVGAAESVLHTLLTYALPWFDQFDDPDLLHRNLLSAPVPLVDSSTALELILAEFGVREARRYLRTTTSLTRERIVLPEVEEYELDSDRRAVIAAYYKL